MIPTLIAMACSWKLVHGDVFRPPRYLELLAALVGTGVQLALLVLSVILITIAGKHLPDDTLPLLVMLCVPKWQILPAVLTHLVDCKERGWLCRHARLPCRHPVHGAGDHCDGVHHLLCTHILRGRLCQV